MASRAYDVDERLLRTLTNKQQQLKNDVFDRPPKTMDDFNIRLGRYLELQEMVKMMLDDAKGIEKD